MNERIREFVRTSHLDVYGLGKDREKWEYTIDQFTELIIQECCAIVDQHEPLNTWTKRYSTLIQEHFGIEE